MFTHLNVLVYPSGTEVGLEIHKALCDVSWVTLFGANNPTANHGPYVYANHSELPDAGHVRFIPELNDLIYEKDINAIFPAHDDVIEWLSERRDFIRPPCQLITSPHETCRITRSKSLTYELLRDVVKVPKIYTNKYPGHPFLELFIKPDKGQGAHNSYKITSVDGLARYLHDATEPMIVTEYLPGHEYTVDCFSDRDGGLQYCAARQRKRTRAGIAMESSPVFDNDDFRKMAEAICTKLKFHGAWFFQVKRDADYNLTLLEVAPRIAGTSCISRVRGVNLPLLSLYEALRLQTTIKPNDMYVTVDRSLHNRYEPVFSNPYNAVYVDLDDTLVVHGKVNTDLVKFIYQCINKKMPIYLITRRCEGLNNYLMDHKLDGLFDEIYPLYGGYSKSKYIDQDERPIFIDDSFAERKEVHDKLGIPVFDCSQIEMLIDDRK